MEFSRTGEPGATTPYAGRSQELDPTRGHRLPPSLPVPAVVAVAVADCSSGDSLSGPPVGGSGPRAADACTMLTSGQVAAIVGPPGPYSVAHEGPAEDGTPVWGCTWGTQTSHADLRELDVAQFSEVGTPDADTTGREASAGQMRAKSRAPRLSG